MKQKFNEFFSKYLIRWRGKLSLMKQQPAESDQLVIVMEGYVPMLSRKLKDLGLEIFKSCTDLGYKKSLIWLKKRSFSVGGHQKERE